MLLFWFWSLVIPIVHMLDHLSLFYGFHFLSILSTHFYFHFILFTFPFLSSMSPALYSMVSILSFIVVMVFLLLDISPGLCQLCFISSLPYHFFHYFFSYFVVYSHKGTYFLNWGVLFCFSFFKPKILVIICIFSMAKFSRECSFSVSNNVCCPFFLLFFFSFCYLHISITVDPFCISSFHTLAFME